MIAAAWALPSGAAAKGGTLGGDDPGIGVLVVVLPIGTEPADLAEAGLSPGALSPGIGTVTPDQTFLDISQGNRMNKALYDHDLPELVPAGTEVSGWDQVVERAEDAPADLVPGLLASTLHDAGLVVVAEQGLLSPSLIAADREGRIARIDRRNAVRGVLNGLVVVGGTVEGLPDLIGRLRPNTEDLLIAIESPPTERRTQLAIGVTGAGFDGNLTSDTTRADGYVLSTDIAPTILDRLGIPIPDEMIGEPIRSEGEVDAGAVQDLVDRMTIVAPRRDRVIGNNLVLWTLLAGLVVLLSRGRLARPAVAILGLTAVCMPTVLLLAPILDPSATTERAVVALGSPLLAGLLFAVFRGWTALAVACGLLVGAYAVDILVGSPLTFRSLLGPNPGLGVRFYGIGNEIEAVLAVAIPVGVGAALQAVAWRRGEPPDRRVAIAAFAGTAVVLAALFAWGRFGADVGAAIVFPAGAAAAILALPGALGRRRLVVAVVAAPVLGLALLGLLDLIFGGDSHLSRSVLEAGGSDELADVAERRLRQSARSFSVAIELNLFRVAVVAAIAGLVFSRRILGWLADVPFARAGFLGAAFSVALGVIANDSGAAIFAIGTLGLMACVAVAWGNLRRNTGSAGV